MNKKANIVIFVDALSYEISRAFLEKGKKSLKSIKIIPGAGYSSNLHWTLFKGSGPDEVGFFTDWNLCRGTCQMYQNKVTANYKLLDKIYVLNVLVRVFLRKFTSINDNIPFSERKFFKNEGKYLFSSLEKNTEYLKRKIKAIKRKCYIDTFNDAYKHLNEDDLFLIIEDLDHIGHEAGGTGENYRNTAMDILNKSLKFYKEYSRVHENVNFIIISDHGMADINVHINVMYPLINKFGLPGENYYFYNDSLYLRFWFLNDNVRSDIMKFILNSDIFTYLNHELRIKYKIKNRIFGDEMFVLKKGYVFEPNCFGVSVKSNLAGMHGYLEADNDTSGMIITNLNFNFMSIYCEELYKILSEKIGELK